MKKYLKAAMIGLLAICLQMSGCMPVQTNIAYTIYPLGFLIGRISGDTVKYDSIQDEQIIQRATIREDYEEILTNAKVFFHIGQMEPYLGMYNEKINSLVGSSQDLSILNAVYEFKRYTPAVAGDTVAYIEGPYYSGEVFETIDTDTKDLYFWTDPIAMLSMAKDIRDWLVENYPDEKAAFEDNFDKVETELIILDAQYQSMATNMLKSNKMIRFVSMTASFGNWQKTYGIEVYPIILSKYGVLPNEQQLALIKQRINDDGVHYIVYEPNMTDDMVELFEELEEELHLTRVELSNLSSLTAEEEAAGKDYLSIMYENLKVLETMIEDRPSAAAIEAAKTTEAAKEYGSEADDRAESKE